MPSTCRALVYAVCCAALVGCSEEPTAPAQLDGTYILVAINEVMPPQTIWVGEGDTLRLDSARIELRADRTGQYMVAQALIVPLGGGTTDVTAWRSTYDITFARLPDRVVFSFDPRLGLLPDTLHVEPTGLTDSIRVGGRTSTLAFLRL
jgi:hypothetical protein